MYLSKPNIPPAEIERFAMDDTNPVDFRVRRDGRPMDLTGRAYEIRLWPNGLTTAPPVDGIAIYDPGTPEYVSIAEAHADATSPSQLTPCLQLQTSVPS
jgi:hypothetical protein